MFESLLHALTLVALGLLVPSAGVAMMMARGRHASANNAAGRGGRVALAAVTAAAAGGAVAWFLGSGPIGAAVAALLLGAPVVVWAFLAPWWPVRAVVAWAMLVVGSISVVGLAAARALESAEPWTAVPVTAVGAALVVLVLERLNGPFRRLLGIRAGIRRAVRTPVYLRPALLRPGLALAVFFAALAAGGLTGVAPRPGDGRYPGIGAGPAPGRGNGGPDELDGADVRPVSADATPAEEAAAVQGAVASQGVGTAAGAGVRPGAGAGQGGSGGARGGSGTYAARAGGGNGGEQDSTAPLPGGGGGDANDTVNDAVRQVNHTVDTVVRKVEDAIEPVRNTGGGGTTQSPVEQTVEPVRSAVEETVAPVAGGTGGAVEQVTGQVTDTVGVSLP